MSKINVTLVMFLIKDDEVLFFKNADAEGLWDIPRGIVYEGIPMSISSIKELEKNIGIYVDVKDLCGPLVMHYKGADIDKIFYFSYAKKRTGDISINHSDIYKEFRWFSIDNLPERTPEYITKGLKLLLEGEKFVEYGFVK